MQPESSSTVRLALAVAGKRQHPNLAQTRAAILTLLNALKTAASRAGRAFRPTLLSGLADGGDTIAAQALLQWNAATNSPATLTGVFPFELEDYLQTISDKAQFQTLLAACDRKIFLDGRYLPGDDEKAKAARAAAYRQQARYLIEAGDVLLAIADERETGKAGGTLETAGLAFGRGMTVVFLSLRSLECYLLSSVGQLAQLRTGDTADIASGAAAVAEALLNTFNIGN